MNCPECNRPDMALMMDWYGHWLICIGCGTQVNSCTKEVRPVKEKKYTIMPLEPTPVKTSREAQLEREVEAICKTAHKMAQDIHELQQRLIEKTNAYLDCDVKKNKRIQELENAIEIAVNHCDERLKMVSILNLALHKNKQRYE